MNALNIMWLLNEVGCNTEIEILTGKSKGVIVGTVSSMFETKDVDTDSIWYAVVNVEHLDHNLEIKVSKLLGVL